MNFSQTLDKMMNERGVTAYKISKETGISDRLIGYWRNGEKLPGAENLLTIANYFGISVDYLLTGSNFSDEFSDIETKLVSDYRLLSDQGQEYIQQQMFMAKEVYKKADIPDSEVKTG